MNFTFKMFISVVLLSLLYALPVYAEEEVSGEELKKLLSGNTAEGQLIRWETSHKTYFDPSGDMRRVDGKNNKEQGVWQVDKYGRLCIEVKKERCRTVKKRSDGGYNVYSRREELKYTFDKIVPGNPNNL